MHFALGLMSNHSFGDDGFALRFPSSELTVCRCEQQRRHEDCEEYKGRYNRKYRARAYTLSSLCDDR